MDGRWRDSTDVIQQCLSTIGTNDGCIECGYAFAYELEGCDSCKPITDLFVAVGRAHQDGDRS